MRLGLSCLLFGGLLLGPATPGRADLVLLTRGAVLTLRARSDPARSTGLVRFGKDPALIDAPSPACPAASRFELGVYPVATARVVRGPALDLDCSKWRALRDSWLWTDRAAPGGVRKIRYGPKGIVVKLAGPDALPAPGPVGYALAWLEVDGRRFHGRFHRFEKNAADLLVGRRPSKLAADGEAAFWAVLWGDDRSEEKQAEAMDLLERATRRSRKDGRSPFLLGMLHLYRFGAMIGRPQDADAAARAEIAAAMAAFERAEPLLWDRTTGVGDSRVPGFVAAARYDLGLATGDAAERQRGLEDLRYAIEINPFFNVFDLIAVAQNPPASEEFQLAFAEMAAYLEDPETIACVGEQPEICGNAGLAPSNVSGSLVLFGDLYAKAGNLDRATFWYTLAAATESGWAWEGLAADRLATVEARIAAYDDPDPATHPLVIGAFAENCVVCHSRPVE